MALVALGVAIPVAGALVLALRDPILEAWHRSRLERTTGDEAWALALRLEATGAAGRRAAEGWYLERLERGPEREMLEALKRLVDLRCVRTLVPAARFYDRFRTAIHPEDREVLMKLRTANMLLADLDATVLRDRSAEARREFLRAASSSDASVRAFACRLLGSAADGDSDLPRLELLSLRDEDATVRASAAWALQGIQARRVACRRSPSPGAGVSVKDRCSGAQDAECLGRIALRAAVGLLESASAIRGGVRRIQDDPPDEPHAAEVVADDVIDRFFRARDELEAISLLDATSDWEGPYMFLQRLSTLSAEGTAEAARDDAVVALSSFGSSVLPAALDAPGRELPRRVASRSASSRSWSPRPCAPPVLLC